MPGRKVWAADEVLTANDLNDFLMDQAVAVFASAGARSAAILVPEQGMLTYRTDGGVYESWNGSAWAQINAGFAVNAQRVGGITIFNSAGTPTANATGDLWFF
jgi:hypothetical protein